MRISTVRTLLLPLQALLLCILLNVNPALAGQAAKSKLESSDVNELTKAAFELAESSEVGDFDFLIRLAESDLAFRNMVGSLAASRSLCKGKSTALKRLLKSEKWWHRRNGAWIVGMSRHNDKEVRAILQSSLEDENWEVRMYAAWALGRIGAKDALPALRKLATKSEGMKDGVEAAHASKTIGKGSPLLVEIKLQPPWLLVADQDIPLQVISGPVISVTGSPKNFFRYDIETDYTLKDKPLKVTIWNYMVVYWGGHGSIKDKWVARQVSLSANYVEGTE